MSDDGEALLVGLIFAAAGLACVAAGFKRLRLKKLVEGLATSKVRSMAVGVVELAGAAEPVGELLDPIFGRPCALYHVLVEEHRRSGKRSRWVKIHERNSYAAPFRLRDETGGVLVLPHGVEPYLREDVSHQTGMLFSSAPEPVTRYLDAVGGGGFGRSRRLTACIVRPGERVYVLGYAAPAEDPLTLREKLLEKTAAPLQAAARRLKCSPERMKALDTDGDGRVDEREWDAGLQAFYRELHRSGGGAAAGAAAGDPPLLVRRSPEGLLVISDRSEEDLVAHLGWKCFLQVLGGAAATIGASAYLLVRFRLW